jgi:hypothetical protein
MRPLGSTVFQQSQLRAGTDELQRHVVAHRVHIRADKLRFSNRLAPDGLEHAQKRLLPDIFDYLPRGLPAPQLDLDQFAEILREMPLDLRVSGLQAFEIHRVEAVEAHMVGQASWPSAPAPPARQFMRIRLLFFLSVLSVFLRANLRASAPLR